MLANANIAITIRELTKTILTTESKKRKRKMFVMIHVFFLEEKFLYENELQKPQNLKKILRKSPASDASAASFKKLFKSYKILALFLILNIFLIHY